MPKKRVIQVYNSSPEPMDWVSVILDDAEGTENTSNFDLKTLISIEPSNGHVKPYSAQKVEVSFSPKVSLPKPVDVIIYTQFSIVSSATGTDGPVDSSSMPNVVEFAIKGTIHPILFNLSTDKGSRIGSKHLNFGKCEINSESTIKLQIQNPSTKLPLNIELSQMSNFTVEPRVLLLDPLASVPLTLKFKPHQLGTLSQRVIMKLRDNENRKFTFIPGVKFPVRFVGVGTCEPVDPKTKIILDKKYIPPLIDFNSSYTFTASQRAKQQSHLAKYNGEIGRVAQANKTTQKQQKSIYQSKRLNNSVELGIVPLDDDQSKLKPILGKNTSAENGPIILKNKKTAQSPGATSNKSLTKSELRNLQRSTKYHKSEIILNDQKNNWKCLTPYELHHVVVGPSQIEFANVTVKSAACETIQIMNNLQEDILFELDIKCDELAHTSPVELIVLKGTSVDLPLVFESDNLGEFHASLSYRINRDFSCHLLIHATVVKPSLELQQDQVNLHFVQDQSYDSEMRKTVEVKNNQNAPVEFRWTPVIDEDAGFAFSMRPAAAVVNPFSSLLCELTYHASYFAPKEGQFDLLVDGNDPQRFICHAAFDSPGVQFNDRRINFGAVPLNLKTVKYTYLKNTHRVPAVFVIDRPQDLPGFTIEPNAGVLPVGGILQIKIEYLPTHLHKFDFSLKVRVRSGNKSEIRVGGVVEPPIISTDKDAFDFHAVPCGAQETIPFCLTNQQNTKTEIHFDFEQEDFFVTRLDEQVSKSPFIIGPKSTAEFNLTFAPLSVTSFDFVLPVVMNGIRGDLTPNRVDGQIVMSQNSWDKISPSRRVIATSRRTILLVEPVPTNVGSTQRAKVTNVSADSVSVKFNETPCKRSCFDSDQKILDQSEMNLLPESSMEVEFEEIPENVNHVTMIVNSRFAQNIPIVTEAESSGDIYFEPSAVYMEMAPLNTAVCATFTIKTRFLPQNSNLQLEICSLSETEDLSFQFVDNVTTDSDGDIVVEVQYRSSVSLSATRTIHVIDDTTGKRYPLDVHVAADNSILSCYNFLAQRGSTHQVVRTGRSDSKMELMLVPFGEDLDGRPLTQLSSNSRTKTPVSTLVVSSGNPGYGSSMSHLSSNQSSSFPVSLISDMTSLQAQCFDIVNTEMSFFYTGLIASMEKWFSANGWMGGAFPVKIPTTIRSLVTRSIGQNKGTARLVTGTRNDMPTIYDMIINLSGHHIPGIPHGQLLPKNPIERALQLRWQNDVMIKILVAQGARFNTVQGEQLLDWPDYCNFCKAESRPPLDRSVWELVSQRSWVDFLLQTYKCLVLRRVEKLHTNTSTLTHNSNIYGPSETILLEWINEIFESERKTVWPENTPPQRWIVNFDYDWMDGLVLAAVMSRYCPWLIKPYFARMYGNAYMPELCLHNALIVTDAMRDIHIDFDIAATEITDPNPVTMLIFVNYLSETLPHLKPTKSIVFKAQHSKPSTKVIALSNSSRKPISYESRFIGPNANCFKLLGPSAILIQPKNKRKVEIVFQSSSLYQREGIVIFSGGSSPGAHGKPETTSFNLVGQIEHFTPETEVSVEQSLYEEQIVSLKFDVMLPGESFNIQLFETPLLKGNVTMETISQEDAAITAPREFHCDSKSTTETSLSNGTINIRYMPLQQHRRQCYIILSNGSNVQFAGRINARGILPIPAHLPNQKAMKTDNKDIVFWECNVGEENLTSSIAINPCNAMLDRALHRCALLSMSNVERRRRLKTDSLASKSILSRFVNEMYLADAVEFEISVSSDNFNLPRTLTWSKSQGSSVNIPIELTTRKPGRYPVVIVLNGRGPSVLDTRVIRLEAILTGHCTTTSLTLECSARERLVQNIPLLNNTPHDWPMVSKFISKATDKIYSGPKEFMVHPGDCFLYPLTFSPKYIETYETKLVIENTFDGTVTTFNITGYGTEPRVTERLTFKNVKCGEKRRCSIILPSFSSRKMRFDVQTTLGSILTGREFVESTPGENARYDFELCTRSIGQLSGILSFSGFEVRKENNPEWESDDEDEFGRIAEPELIEVAVGQEHKVNYELEIESTRSNPVKEHVIRCAVGEKTEISLPLYNPTPEPIMFHVTLEGDGLEGKDRILVQSNSTEHYNVIYRGCSILITDAGSATFKSDATGEFWYKFKYDPIDPVRIVLDDVKAELGGWIEFTIPCQNRSIRDSCFSISISTNGVILDPNEPREQVLSAGEEREISFVFIPSNIGLNGNEVDIFIESADSGVQVFTINGVGLPPKAFDATHISAMIGKSKTVILPFRNPTLEHCNATIFLIDIPVEQLTEPSSILGQRVNGQNGSLDVLLRKKRMLRLAPSELLDIPVCFSSPDEFTKREAFVAVEMTRCSGKPWVTNETTTKSGHFTDGYKKGESAFLAKPSENLIYDVDGNICAIRFIYPIIALVEMSAPTRSAPLVECEARQRIEQRLEVVLNGAVPSMQPVARIRGKTPASVDSRFYPQKSKTVISYIIIKYYIKKIVKYNRHKII